MLYNVSDLLFWWFKRTGFGFDFFAFVWKKKEKNCNKKKKETSSRKKESTNKQGGWWWNLPCVSPCSVF